MDTKHEEKIRQIALPLVQGLGLTLWGIQCFMAGKKTVLSVFVDTPNAVTSLQSRTKEERDGINLDQCAQVSRDLGLALEVEDIMSGAYALYPCVLLYYVPVLCINLLVQIKKWTIRPTSTIVSMVTGYPPAKALERATGVEPATPSLGSLYSTS